jgi:RNA ligase
MTDRPTCIADLMDEKLLNNMIAEGYIRRQKHPVYDLWIYNYSEKAMFDKLWNKATLTCRGLISDRFGVIIARPWSKFFNLGEKATLIGSHDTVEITDKADGSLGIGYSTPGGMWCVATRGSFTSDQAVWATHWIQKEQIEGNGLFWNPVNGLTPLFEIVYPQNRIVLDYGDFEGLILLGAVDTQMGHVYGPNEAAGLLGWEGERTQVFPEKTMAEFMSGPNANRTNAEGVVVRSGHRMVKVKQDDYVRAHAVVTGLSNRSVWEALSKGEGVPEQASFMPDEFYRWLINTAAILTDRMIAWKTEALVEFDRIHRNTMHIAQAHGQAPSRKGFARLAASSPYRAALFKLFDNQSIDELAWKAVRPETFERPFTQNQDNN